jgi:hypothetical protein
VLNLPKLLARTRPQIGEHDLGGPFEAIGRDGPLTRAHSRTPGMLRNLAEGRVQDSGTEEGGLFRRPGHDYAG